MESAIEKGFRKQSIDLIKELLKQNIYIAHEMNDKRAVDASLDALGELYQLAGRKLVSPKKLKKS